MNTTQAHTNKAYDEELEALAEAILAMGVYVKELTSMAVQAIKTRNPDLVEKAQDKDKKINKLDLDIEHQATVVLALRNPMAMDLRFVTTSLKMATVLERMGDIAKKIAARAVHLGDYNPEILIKPLMAMADRVMKVIDSTLIAIDEFDKTKAEAVFRQDAELNQMYDDFFALLTTHLQKDPENAEKCMDILLLAKNLERLGDYTANIAKSINYVSSGHRSFRKTKKKKPA